MAVAQGILGVAASPGSLLLPYAMSLAAMLLWGSWANTFVLAKTPFELYYMDYALGNLLSGLLQLPSALPSLEALVESPGWAQAWVFSLTGLAGFMYATCIMLLVFSLDLIGMALAVPLMVGIEFLVGVPLLLLIEGVGSAAHVLFSLCGVFAVIVAITLDSLCHQSLIRDAEDELARKGKSLATVQEEDEAIQKNSSTWYGPAPTSTFPWLGHSRRSMSEPSWLTSRFSHGTSLSLLALSQEQVPFVHSSRETPGPEPVPPGHLGFYTIVLAGFFASFWPVLSSIVEGHGIGTKLESAAISPAAFFVMFVSTAMLTGVVTLPPMYSWRTGKEWSAYWRSYLTLTRWQHLLALLGGFTQGVGSLLALQAGEAIGNTISMSIIRCSPVVAAAWGAFLWGDLAAPSSPRSSFSSGWSSASWQLWPSSPWQVL